ncbi:MAG: glutamyl-tRNA reductase [Streptosporangiales bacterium]|nr:glutamyl-tRNA reductase [Streptosporangiales bacterium]
MSVLVVGLSHKSAPVTTLERASVSGDTLGKLIEDVVRLTDVAETFVISTCNRVEIYAEIDRFHPAVTGITELLARYSGIPTDELTQCLYVHYEDRAVQYLLAVASGLESMVVGEDQILGQVRNALKLAGKHGTLGRALGDLGRAALRAGKRARTETGIDRLGISLATVGVQLAADKLRVTPNGASVLSGTSVLVIGAGAMSGVSVATAARAGAARVVVTNRTPKKAERLAASVAEHAPGVAGEVADFENLPAAVADADLVISCTGASGVVVTESMIRSVWERREPGRTLALLDLAMPRDIDPAVADVPGTHVIGMDELRGGGDAAVGAAEVTAVRAIVDEEFAGYASAVRAASVTPTVVALRAKAATVVDTELARLEGRLSDEGLSGHAVDEIARTVHRVVDKLLHAPTVRIKELASSPGGEEYATALRVLFDLDPRTVEAVTHAEVDSATPGGTPPGAPRPGGTGQKGATN